MLIFPLNDVYLKQVHDYLRRLSYHSIEDETAPFGMACQPPSAVFLGQLSEEPE